MLYIVSKIPSGEETEEVWYVEGSHVGTPRHRPPRTHPTEVIEVQADGDELAYILNRFTNLPGFQGRCPSVVRWFGPTAQFIVANL